MSGLPGTAHSAGFDDKALGWAFAAYVGVAWLIVLWLFIRPKLVTWHAVLVTVLALVTQLRSPRG